MRLAALALSSLLVIAACERQSGGAPAEPAEPVNEVQVIASDELAGLAASATGIAFWTHPNVAFNGLMIVASADGVVGYNIEDGSEVSRLPGVDAQGVAVSYFGFGPQARGLLAYFDQEASAFKIHAVDNASRTFQPVEGEIPIRGAVRGFCFGRALGAHSPSLHVVQRNTLTTYAFSAENSVVTASADIGVSIPNDARACAVNEKDGTVLLVRENGRVHPMEEDGPGAPLLIGALSETGDAAVLLSRNGDEDAPSVQGQIVMLDRATGKLHVYDSESGEAIGVATIILNDEGDALDAAEVMGAASANLGGLYRNGAIALGLAPTEDGGEASIRLIPVNGLINALDLTVSEPLSPRGDAPEPEDNGLLIETNFELDTD